MSFYENMSPARKRIVLTASKDALETEMLQIIIRLGLNPETFDETSYNTVPDNLSPTMQSDAERLVQICKNYQSTVDRLNNLDS